MIANYGMTAPKRNAIVGAITKKIRRMKYEICCYSDRREA